MAQGDLHDFVKILGSAATDRFGLGWKFAECALR
jgi:hypothetical protein